jgi:hypothetical protein
MHDPLHKTKGDDMKKLSKDDRINAEIDRLDSIFSDLDSNTRTSIDGLLRRAAYMRVTLEDYEKDLDEHGYVEAFTQSPNTPPYERERPVARLYNAMNKNYQSIMKQLIDSLPSSLPADASKEIKEYLSGVR